MKQKSSVSKSIEYEQKKKNLDNWAVLQHLKRRFLTFIKLVSSSINVSMLHFAFLILFCIALNKVFFTFSDFIMLSIMCVIYDN